MERVEVLGQGREAEVFLLADGTVLKLMRDAAHGERVRREAAACRALRSVGHLAPAVLDTVTVDGRPGLVMERVDGAAMLAALERRPWSVLAIARVLAEAHAAVHDRPAPPELPEVHDQLRERIDRARVPDDMRALSHALLDALPRGDRLCHGDFHIGNVLGAGADAVVIDWGYASRGDPTGDVAQTALLHRTGALPPGTSPLLGALARVGRGLLVGRYLATYRRARPIDRRVFDQWLFVHAAARLGEPVPEEHPALHDVLRSGRRRLEP